MEAYTIPKYRTVIPSTLCATSFIVMFGLMFPDVWHGILLVIFGLIMTKLKGNPKVPLKYRSVLEWNKFIIILGCQSIISGMMFNSLFSKPVFPLQFSNWKVNETLGELDLS